MNYNYSYNNNYICSSISPNSNNYKNNNEAREQVCTQQKFGYFLDPSVFSTGPVHSEKLVVLVIKYS